MKYWRDHWSEIEGRISSAKMVLLALDYDGVLSPIAHRPEHAKISVPTRNLLRRLASHPAFTVAVVTGRALYNIQSMVGLKGIIYAGNHGLEISAADKMETHVDPGMFQEELAKAKLHLTRLAQSFSGAFVEDKGISLTLHYRGIKEDDWENLQKDFMNWAQTLHPSLRICLGKKIYEIRPSADWDKGDAVLKIWRKEAPHAMPIYVGDDHTDEDVFNALKHEHVVTLYVGENGKSTAEYFAHSSEDVFQFLMKVDEISLQFPDPASSN
jgi:trehalose-phosphatase